LSVAIILTTATVSGVASVDYTEFARAGLAELGVHPRAVWAIMMTTGLERNENGHGNHLLDKGVYRLVNSTDIPSANN
jgi:hypothetical protein